MVILRLMHPQVMDQTAVQQYIAIWPSEIADREMVIFLLLIIGTDEPFPSAIFATALLSWGNNEVTVHLIFSTYLPRVEQRPI